jgi:hypothetical protein
MVVGKVVVAEDGSMLSLHRLPRCRGLAHDREGIEGALIYKVIKVRSIIQFTYNQFQKQLY